MNQTFPDNAVSAVVKKLSTDTYELSEPELTTLMWMMGQDSPEAHAKAVFAFNLTFDIDFMINELQQVVREDARKRPSFNARLKPLYEQYFASLQGYRLKLFYRVCKTILQDSWIFTAYECAEYPRAEYPFTQLEFSFYDDDF